MKSLGICKNIIIIELNLEIKNLFQIGIYRLKRNKSLPVFCNINLKFTYRLLKDSIFVERRK